MSHEASHGEREPGRDQDQPDAPLRSYLRARQSIARVIADARAVAERAAPWAVTPLQDLLGRIAEDAFELVVVGQFKRGKSSLMNAMVGRSLLPTGILPVTSVVTSLRYGPVVRAVIRREGLAMDQPVPIDALGDYVSERGNPGNRKGVLGAEVEVPAPFLRRGLRFVDTPGIGSAHEHNTAATLAFLPQADAAIFVTGADGPLSDVELAFLDAVRQHVRKLFFVLNKVDLVGDAEREEVAAYTRRLIAGRLGVDAIPLFPVSAVRALASNGADPGALAASGLPELESALAVFLDHERRGALLVAALDRTIRLIEEVLAATGPSQDAGRLSAPDDVARLRPILAHAVAARAALLAGVPLPQPAPGPTLIPSARPTTEPGAAPATPRRRAAGTCEICAAAADAVFDLLCRHQYAIAHDAATQREFLAARGLCPPHTWHLERLASARGVSAGYPPLLDRAADRLGGMQHLPAATISERLGQLVSGADACPACLARRRAEQAAAARLVRRLAVAEDRAAFEESEWLCLPHLRLVMTGVDDDLAAALVRVHARRFGDLAESMREHVVKLDARRRWLISREELAAPRRALVMLVVERYLFRTEHEE
jgi:GTP-binding protein EngB required for normal cell division